MKRLLNIALIVTSLIGYLEWGGNNHKFIFQIERELLFGTTVSSNSFLHPFILIPLIGQLLLLISVLKKEPNKTITYAGLSCLSVIMLFLFLTGIISQNIKIALSTIPFIAVGIGVLYTNRKKKENPKQPAQ